MVAALALAAVAVALVAGRSEVIRLMPQTAAFFNTLGLGVNPRGIEIENVRVSSDKVDGTTMMLVEGNCAHARMSMCRACDWCARRQRHGNSFMERRA